jgi:hypothetical protein
MPEFQMIGSEEPGFQALDEFTQGYIEAMFFTEEATGVTTEQWPAMEDTAQGSIPGDVGFTDIAPGALDRIKADCERWRGANSNKLHEAYKRTVDGKPYTPERAGHDFWFSRNGHGVGFWSRDGLGYLGDELTRAAREAGEVYVYLGDDGKVYVL